MKRKLAISFLFVFTMAVAAPAFANTLPQDPQKKECTETKKECDKSAEKKAECAEKEKACDKSAEKKACCDKKAEAPKK